MTAGNTKTGLAIVTAVRDRAADLRVSLARWSADDAVDEIVMVDWGSAVPLARTDVLEFPKTVLLTAGAGEPWAPGLALNLGIEAAGAELVLCLPPGTVLRDVGGAAATARARGGFLSDRGIEAAAVLAARADLLAVGGWHEFLLGDGFAGQDLFNRLEDGGARRLFLAGGALEMVRPLEAPVPSPGELRIALPAGMERDPFFIGERNKLLAGLAPWNGVLASLRPRRLGRPEPRRVNAQLGPRTAFERRLQDVASYLTARFVSAVPEEISFPMFAEMVDDRSGTEAARAGRQYQVDAMLAACAALVEPPPERRPARPVRSRR